MSISGRGRRKQWQYVMTLTGASLRRYTPAGQPNTLIPLAGRIAVNCHMRPRETGARPVRTRHCNWMRLFFAIDHCQTVWWEGEEAVVRRLTTPRSQETGPGNTSLTSFAP